MSLKHPHGDVRARLSTLNQAIHDQMKRIELKMRMMKMLLLRLWMTRRLVIPKPQHGDDYDVMITMPLPPPPPTTTTVLHPLLRASPNPPRNARMTNRIGRIHLWEIRNRPQGGIVQIH